MWSESSSSSSCASLLARWVPPRARGAQEALPPRPRWLLAPSKMRVPNSVYGGMLTVGLAGLGLLTFAPGVVAADVTAPSDLVIGSCRLPLAPLSRSLTA